MGGHKTLNEPGKPKRLERWSPSQAARRGRLITLGPSRGPALLHHPVGHDREVLKAERADIDLERGVWTKPSHHTKQKRREHVPLSAEAQALVSAVLVLQLCF